MLIRFNFENFLSFKEETEFSMVAGRSQQHQNHKIISQQEHIPSLLRAAAIFGKNASGKSNLVRALMFAKRLVVQGVSKSSNIPVRPFRLNQEQVKKPSSFRFELLINNRIYDYGFVLNRKEILEEWLIEVRRTTEVPLFTRVKNKITLGKIDFSQALKENSGLENESLNDKKLRLSFVGKDTLENELFLTTSVERKQPYFKEIYDWFDDSLNIIRPDSKFMGTELQLLEGEKSDFIKDYESILKKLDTGIEGIELVELNDIDKEFVKAYAHLESVRNVFDELEENSLSLLTMPDERRFVLTKDKVGKVSCRRLMTKHKVKNRRDDTLFKKLDEYELFELHWESQGTQRLMDLIPMLFIMKNKSTTFVIDEISRSLHPDVAYKLVRLVLMNESFKQCQLIFSTHQDYLMSLDLLRKDEVWFTKKDESGESSIYSLEEFKPRYDKDIRRGYLKGRFGGVPYISESDLNRVFAQA